jgi:hypothetical protein
MEANSASAHQLKTTDAVLFLGHASSNPSPERIDDVVGGKSPRRYLEYCLRIANCTFRAV